MKFRSSTLIIAPAMSTNRDGTPKDVQGAFASEGYLQTIHDYLIWLAQQAANPEVTKAKPLTP